MQRSTVSLMNLSALCGTAAVVSHAFHAKKQFYPSMVYISNSGISMMFVYYQIFVMAVNSAKIFQSIFFGRLRTLELEHIYDRSWFAVTETCLAMTIFRDEFTAKTAAEFCLLLMVKMFHWLVQDRVAFMEQTPNITRLFHARMVGVSAILAATDAFLVYSAGTLILAQGPSMALLFGFEYVVLLAVIVATFFKYVLQCIDLHAENGWDGKAIFVFYADLVLDFVKLAVYLVFFVVVMNFYGLPLHIIRDLCATFRSFAKRLHDFVQSRKATRLLDKYPEATAEQIAQVDSVCVICRDEMEAGAGVKRLPCGHIFHQKCLRTWLHQQQICAICRADVLEMDQNHPRHHHAPNQAPNAAAAPNPPPTNPPNAANPDNIRGAAGGSPAGVPSRAASGATPAPVQGPGGGAATPTGHAPGVGAGPTGGLYMPPPPPMAVPPHLPPPPFGAHLPSPTMFGAHLPSPGLFAPGVGGHMPPPPPLNQAFGLAPPPGFVPFTFTPHVARPMELMTDAELHELEGSERSKVVQRIAFLRNFRAEVDGVLARFGQYDQMFAAGAGGSGVGSTAVSPMMTHLPFAAARRGASEGGVSPSAAVGAVGSPQHASRRDLRASGGPSTPIELNSDVAATDASGDSPAGEAPYVPCVAPSPLRSPGGAANAADARDVIRGLFAGTAASAAADVGTKGASGTTSDDAAATREASGVSAVLEDHPESAAKELSEQNAIRQVRLRRFGSKGDVAENPSQ